MGTRSLIEDAGGVGQARGMARLARIAVPDCPHHLTQRGNRRQPTFFSDDDGRSYLALPAEACRATRVGLLPDAEPCASDPGRSRTPRTPPSPRRLVALEAMAVT